MRETVCLATIWPRDPHGRSEAFVLGELLREYGAREREWALRVVVASAHREALEVARGVMAGFADIRADFWWMETEHAGTRPEEISFCKEQLPPRLAAERGWDWLLFYDADVWTRLGQVPEWMGHIGGEHEGAFVKIKYTLRDKLESPAHTLGAYFHHRALLERLEYGKVVFPRFPDGQRRNAPDCVLHDFLRRNGCRKVVPESMATLHFTDPQNARVFAGGASFDARGVRDAAGGWSGGRPPVLAPEWERLDAPPAPGAVAADGGARAGYVHLVPYSQAGHLAEACNEAIAALDKAVEWILVTDADVMLLTPRYGHLIAQAIAANPGAGLMTCVTNRIGPTCQRAAEVPRETSDLLELRAAAVARWTRYGAAVTPVAPPCSGFFLLFRRAVWQAVGGFKGRGLLGVDWRFSREVAAAGFPILRMDGLLAVHFYRLDGGNQPASAALPKAIAPRTEILNALVRTRGLRSYLEIGTRNPAENYARIRCAEKTGVDPAPRAAAPGIVRKRSDDFFRTNRRKFDLIFIDGDHHTEAVARDLAHGLAALTPGGVLVLHDALPPAETYTREEDRPANGGAWTGGVWEAVLRHFSHSGHGCCIVDADWGVAIVDTRRPRRHGPLPALPEGPLSYAAHFPLLAPFRMPLEEWRTAQESEWLGRE